MYKIHIHINSCTQELRDCIKEEYAQLDPFEQGGPTFLYLIMAKMFQMTTDVVTALKSVIAKFGRDGVAKIRGENVSVLAKQISAVAKSLARVNALPDEAVLDVLKGLSLGSVSKFTDVFKLEHTKTLSSQSNSTYCGGSATALDEILCHLSLATKLYNLMSTGNSWHVPGGSGGHRANSCWNCGGDHGVNRCTKPKDQNKIAANKKKWEDEKKKKSAGGGNGGHNGSRGSGGAGNGSGGGQYERKKFGDGVQKINNVWHMVCNKGCGWNTTHTTKYHGAFTPNPSAYPTALPSTHPYHLKVAKDNHGVSPTISPSTSPSSSCPLTSNLITIDKAKWMALCDHHERNVTDPSLASFFSLLQSQESVKLRRLAWPGHHPPYLTVYPGVPRFLVFFLWGVVLFLLSFVDI
eukprot:scaffold173548_cov23-Cyclotella_meneghiniana.AAC.1